MLHTTVKTSLSNHNDASFQCGCGGEENFPDFSSLQVLFGTTTGTAKTFANKLASKIARVSSMKTEIVNLQDYDVDNLEKESFIFVISFTWMDDVPPETASNFFLTVSDLRNDLEFQRIC